MEPSRRKFLKKGILGGVILAAGGVGALMHNTTEMTGLPPQALAVLSLREFSILRAVASRMIPFRKDFPSPEDIHSTSSSDAILSRVSPDAQKEVKQLLILFDTPLVGLLLDGSSIPFTRLSSQAQDERLRRWQSSRIVLRRTGFQALRSLVMASYYSSPLTWPAIGYPGPPDGFYQP